MRASLVLDTSSVVVWLRITALSGSNFSAVSVVDWESISADTRTTASAGAHDRGEHGLDLLGEVLLHLLAVTHLARRGAEQRVLLEFLGEDVAVVVDDGDLVGHEPLNGVGDEVADRVDLLGLKAALGKLDENGGGRLDGLVSQQQAALGLDDHDAGGLHALQLRDRAGELALEGADEIGALDEIAQAELALVENLKAHAVAGRDALAGEVHAQAVNLIRRNIHGRTPGTDRMGDVFGLQLAEMMVAASLSPRRP